MGAAQFQSAHEPRTIDELRSQVFSVNALARRCVHPKTHCAHRVDLVEDDVVVGPLWRTLARVVVSREPALPPGHEVRRDPESGRPVYIDHAARATSWDPPWPLPFAPLADAPVPADCMATLTTGEFSVLRRRLHELVGEPEPSPPRSPSSSSPPPPAAAAEAAATATAAAPPELATAPALGDEDCAVCMERKSTVVLPCTHAFCQECLEGWRGRSETCPMCRANVKGADAECWVLAPRLSTKEEIDSSVAELLDAVIQSHDAQQ
eukprot:m51a1_g11043 putative ring finger protein 141 (265) ;mRNA; r:452129-453109